MLRESSNGISFAVSISEYRVESSVTFVPVQTDSLVRERIKKEWEVNSPHLTYLPNRVRINPPLKMQRQMHLVGAGITEEERSKLRKTFALQRERNSLLNWYNRVCPRSRIRRVLSHTWRIHTLTQIHCIYSRTLARKLSVRANKHYLTAANYRAV